MPSELRKDGRGAHDLRRRGAPWSVHNPCAHPQDVRPPRANVVAVVRRPRGPRRRGAAGGALVAPRDLGRRRMPRRVRRRGRGLDGVQPRRPPHRHVGRGAELGARGRRRRGGGVPRRGGGLRRGRRERAGRPLARPGRRALRVARRGGARRGVRGRAAELGARGDVRGRRARAPRRRRLRLRQRGRVQRLRHVLEDRARDVLLRGRRRQGPRLRAGRRRARGRRRGYIRVPAPGDPPRVLRGARAQRARASRRSS